MTDRWYFLGVQMPVAMFVGLLGGSYAVDCAVGMARYTGVLPAHYAEALDVVPWPVRLAGILHVPDK